MGVQVSLARDGEHLFSFFKEPSSCFIDYFAWGFFVSILLILALIFIIAPLSACLGLSFSLFLKEFEVQY
jgi:hypothetical protein